jgi:DNA-binding MarR family transcriptional regulator
VGKLLARDGPTITGIIDRLEQKQLVLRKRNASDRRCIHVMLTPKAQGMKDEMTSRLQDSLQKILGDLTRVEMEQLESILTKMHINIQQKIVPRMQPRAHV